MKGPEMRPNFWRGRSVFLTGHTGFKGGWIALWLSHLGAKVHGYSLKAPTTPSFFTETNLKEKLEKSTIADIRDLSALAGEVHSAQPSVIMHLAAQSLVRESYKSPVETFTTNLLGTVNLLEAARQVASVKAIVIVTTDKCYENQEVLRPYRENDRLGGHDPYSSSKACAELAVAAYRSSFLESEGIQLASARAGNVIGGGDWAPDRLVPDFLRALDSNEILRVRHPYAVRPWQHVLEPLGGYLALAERLVTEGAEFAEAWNFGPEEADMKPVSWLLDNLSKKVTRAKWIPIKSAQPYEAKLLKLDSAKAKTRLGWAPRLSLETALDMTLDWHRAWKEKKSMANVSLNQIEVYESFNT